MFCTYVLLQDCCLYFISFDNVGIVDLKVLLELFSLYRQWQEDNVQKMSKRHVWFHKITTLFNNLSWFEEITQGFRVYKCNDCPFFYCRRVTSYNLEVQRQFFTSKSKEKIELETKGLGNLLQFPCASCTCSVSSSTWFFGSLVGKTKPLN